MLTPAKYQAEQIKFAFRILFSEKKSLTSPYCAVFEKGADLAKSLVNGVPVTTVFPFYMWESHAGFGKRH